MTKLGKVYLVGAGPGDPALITVKGQACLAEADLVLYDGLVNPLLLRHTHAEAVRTCRSAAGDDGRRRLNQAEINYKLIEAASEGVTVVRLKSGDPYIFGRGGEEATALAEAGIPFEVVPGITAATSVGAYAGISLTHRNFASAVAFVTGHEDPTKQQQPLDYRALAQFPGTLVFYMGMHHLKEITRELLSAGKPSDTPAAVICKSTWPTQREVFSTLGEIGSAVDAAGLHPPSLIVIGEALSLGRQMDWFHSRPLRGRRIVITRPEHQSDSAIERCLELGAEPIVLPLIEILPPESWDAVDVAIDRLAEFDWLIFTSANGVHGLFRRMWKRGFDLRKVGKARIATIGPATAAALADYCLRADLVPESYRAEALAESLAPHVAGKRVLWARANRGRDVLPEALQTAGAHFEQVVVYRNEDVTELPAAVVEEMVHGEIDWIGLSSPSITRSFAQQLPAELRETILSQLKIACISPVTANAAQDAGLSVHAEATEFTWDGLLDAIADAENSPS